MDHRPLLQCRTKRPVQAVLQVQLALPLDNVGEQVSVERRVLGQQCVEIERPFGGDQLVEPHLARGQV